MFSRYGRKNCYWEGTHSRAHKNLLSPAVATRKPIMPFRKAIRYLRFPRTERYGHPRLWDGPFCGYMEAAPFAVLGLFEIIKSRPMLLPLNPSCSEELSASLGKRIIGIESPVIHWTASLGGGIVGIKTPVIHLIVSLGRCIVRIKPRDTLDRF